MLSPAHKLLILTTPQEAQDWRSRAGALGGGCRDLAFRALIRFIRDAKSSGIWPKLNRVNLFMGVNLASCLVPLKVGAGSATDTNVNFVSGDYTEATGLTGNGTNKYLATGATLTSLPAQSTSLGVYCRTQTIGTTSVFLGTQGPSGVENRSILYSTGSVVLHNTYGNTGGGVISSVLADYRGLVVGSRVSATSAAIYRNGASLASFSASGGTRPDTAVHVFAYNANGAPQLYLNATLAGYFIAEGLTASEVAAFNTIMEAFQDAIGRGVQ